MVAMAMTQSDNQALDVLRWMARIAPPKAAEAVRQTLRVWPMLHVGDKVRHYAQVREICERSCPSIRGKDAIVTAEQALEAQSRLFL